MMINFHSLALLATFVGMLTAAILTILAYHRMGYGKIGKYKAAGYSLVVISLMLNMVGVLAGRNPILDNVIDATRVLGWMALAAGSIALYLEADRSLP